MPQFHANEIHSIRMNVSVGDAYAAVLTADLAESWIVRALLTARAVPGAILSGRLSDLRQRWDSPINLRRFEEAGFRILEEREPDEIVIGLEGRFWTPAGGICHRDREAFMRPVPAGVVRAIWNFSVSAAQTGSCELTTETRIDWTDENAGRSFRRYWRFIAPWSGLTRRLMLRAIRKSAEKGLALTSSATSSFVSR